MDPLSVLRDFTKENLLEQVHIEGERIKFGERYSFPKKIPTTFKRDGNKTATAPAGGVATYDLETLVYFMKGHQNSNWILYVKAAREKGHSQVVFTDKKPLLDYLFGKIDKSDKIQQTAPEFVLPSNDIGDSLEPSTKRAKLEAASASGGLHATATEHVALVSKERILRDRNSQLSLPGKDFKSVLEILAILNREEEAAKSRERKDHQQSRSRPSQSSAGRPPPPPPLSDAGAPPPPPSSAPPAATIRAAEKERARQHIGRPSSHGKGSKTPPGKSQPGNRVSRPIIVVPAAASSKITMLNVKDFLEQGVYKSNETLRKEGAVKHASATILRKIGRSKPVPYDVTDKPPPPKHDDWSRVVAVLVTGATWQFKEWPRGADPGQMAATFHDVLGIHVGLKNEPLSDNLKSWNIQRYSLHPNDRHGDQPIVMEIFKALDKFLSERRRYSHLTY